MEHETKGISAFPKIWALGSKWSQGIFDTEVEITEKLDGSQFGFALTDNGLVVRSKGAVINPKDPPKLFKPAVQHVLAQADELNPQFIYYSEAVCSTRHNTLTYTNTPRNFIALFAVYDNFNHCWLTFPEMMQEAHQISVDCVPLLYAGKANKDIAKSFIGTESYLGGATAEGIVVKAFKDIEIGGIVFPIHSAKYVTEQFKEKHSHNATFRSDKSNTQEFFEQFNTEARFQKAVQKLDEAGELNEDPRDIGKLMKLLNEDLEEECKDDVKDALWNIYRKEFMKTATQGFSEWYKQSLLEQV